MNSKGRPKLENPKGKLISIRLTKDEHAKLKSEAQKHGLTISDYLLKPIRK